MRLMLREVLRFAKGQRWSKEAVAAAYLPLDTEVLKESWPNGIRLHLCDIILTELAGVAGDELDTITFLHLLGPFLELLGR